MKSITIKYRFVFSLLGALAMLSIQPAAANGLIGEHVNQLSDNLDNYTREVDWLIARVEEIVDRYEKSGVAEAGAEAMVAHWQAVDFHAAIETSYLPVYATIWQRLSGVKENIAKAAPIARVREEQRKLEQALWQALGAVKLAAQYQQRGLAGKIRVSAPATSIAALDEIKMRLDRVVATYAERPGDQAVAIVQDTYLNLFEGVEGELIARDAALVEDLEKDFNLTLPRAIQDNASVDHVRQVVKAMRDKLDLARSLLEQARQNKKDVF